MVLLQARIFQLFFWLLQFYFFQICELGNHPKEDLAKFVYRLERKVERFRNCAIWLVASC
jgi:hypothetical protein